MELYAAGLNAWHQLRFDAGCEKPTPDDTEPDDITSFTRVLAARYIGLPVSRFSCTLVETGDGIVTAGYLERDASQEGLRRIYDSVQTATGDTIRHHNNRLPLRFSDIVAGTQDDKSGHPSPDRTVRQIQAYDTGFAVLLDDGSVWVKGDERFPNCLAVNPDEDHAPGSWNRIQWLDDLPTGPVVKIAAGGYALAALTDGGDLYCWGGRPGQRPLMEDLSGMPIPADLGDLDVKDVAIGEHHIIVLTTNGRVLVRGSNKNGQLGLGAHAEDWVADWTSLEDIPWSSKDLRVVGVAAGPKTSFILLQ